MPNLHANMGYPTLIFSAREVTPSDTTLIPATKGLYIGTAGDVTVIHEEDTEAVTYVEASGFLPAKVKSVLSTGTAATDIIALY